MRLSKVGSIIEATDYMQASNAIDALSKSTKGLTQEQAIHYVLRSKLTDEEKEALLIKAGLTAEEAKAIIGKKAHTVATTEYTVATGAASSATYVFKGALDAIASHPIIAVLTAIVAIISLVITQTQKAKQTAEQAAEENRRRTLEAADQASALSDEISDLTDEYLRLSKAVEIDKSNKTSLIQTQNELLKALGVEQNQIDKLAESYGNLDDAIKRASIDALKEAERDLRAAITTNKKAVIDIDTLEKEAIGMGVSGVYTARSLTHISEAYDKNDGLTQSEVDALNALNNHPDYYADNYEVGGIVFNFGIEGLNDTDLDNIEGIIEAYEKLKVALDIVSEESGSNNKIYDALHQQYIKVDSSIKEYKTSIDDLNKNLVQQYIYEGLIGKEIPDLASEFEEYRNSVVDIIMESGEISGNEKDIENLLDSLLKEQDDFAKFYKTTGGLIDYKVSFSELIADDDFSDIVDDYIEKINTLKSALESYQKGDFENEDFIELVRQFPELAGNADNLSFAIKELIETYNGFATDKLGNYINDLKTETDIEQFNEFMSNLIVNLSDVENTTKDTIDVLKELVDVLEDVYEGSEMSVFETLEFIEEYPELVGAIKKTTNGYKLEAEALEELIRLKAENLEFDKTSAKREAARSTVIDSYNTGIANSIDEFFSNYYAENGTNIASWEEFLPAWSEYIKVNPNTFERDAAIKDYVEAIISDNNVNNIIESILSDLNNPENLISENPDWQNFDKLQDNIAKITDEANYLLDLLDTKELYDEFGKLTEYGNAAIGLHGINYSVYIEQAKDYANEIAEIEKELATDPYNQELIKRKEELLEIQRDYVLSIEEEKQAIIDLISEGIEAELDSLKSLIDKYEEALDSAKNLYDYQEKVSDATDEISRIQKMIVAYENDTSEETKAQIQKLKVDLEEAQKELQETEYDQFIADQKKLFDNLYSDYENSANKRLDEIKSNFTNLISAINDNSFSIKETLEGLGVSVGTALSDSLTLILNSETGIGDGTSSVISNLQTGDNTSSIIQESAPVTIIDKEEEAKEAKEAKERFDKLVKALRTSYGKFGYGTIEEYAKNDPVFKEIFELAEKFGFSTLNLAGRKYVTMGEWGEYYDAELAGYGYSVRLDDNGKEIISGVMTEPKWRELKQKGYSRFGEDSYLEYLDLMYEFYVLSPQGKKLSRYKDGGLADYTGLAWVDGTKSKPEAFLDAEDTQNFASLRDMLRLLANDNIGIDNSPFSMFTPVSHQNRVYGLEDKISSLSKHTETINVENHIEITIPIDKVEDYNDFVTKLQSDPKFEKMIEVMTIGRLNGGSSLAKYNYKWK